MDNWTDPGVIAAYDYDTELHSICCKHLFDQHIQCSSESQAALPQGFVSSCSYLWLHGMLQRPACLPQGPRDAAPKLQTLQVKHRQQSHMCYLNNWTV